VPSHKIRSTFTKFLDVVKKAFGNANFTHNGRRLVSELHSHEMAKPNDSAIHIHWPVIFATMPIVGRSPSGAKEGRVPWMKEPVTECSAPDPQVGATLAPGAMSNPRVGATLAPGALEGL
jgi:hypothetical protein